MKDEHKRKDELIRELGQFRQRLAEDAFEFSFPRSINKSLILNLFGLHFVDENTMSSS